MIMDFLNNLLGYLYHNHNHFNFYTLSSETLETQYFP